MVKSVSPKEILQIARVERPAHHLHGMERMDRDAVATRRMGSSGNTGHRREPWDFGAFPGCCKDGRNTFSYAEAA